MISSFRLLSCIVLLAALSLARAAETSFDAWADRISAEWVKLAPQKATQMQYFAGAEQDALDRQLALVSQWGVPWGAAASERRATFARAALEELRRFPRTELSRPQQASAALLEWAFTNAVEAAAFARHQPVFSQFTGLQLDLVNFLTQSHPIRNRRDVENYLVRLEQVAGLIDAGIAEAKAAEEAGFLMPRFITQRTIEQLDGLLLHPAQDNVFVNSLRTRLAALGEGIAPAEREGFVARAEKVTGESIIPAYRRIRELLAAQLPKTTDDAGVWRFPRGAEQYAQALRTYTTTTMTPDEIHAVGQREVARIEGEMDTILRQLGYRDGPVKTRYAALNLSLQPPANPDPRPAILADNEKWVRDAERRAASFFDLLPKAPVVVKREPPFSERTAAAHYSTPAADGSRPGIYWLPLPGPTFDVLGRRSLCYHEAVPGHHFQLALQQELPELPAFRSKGAFGFISAYGEGWALYAERLADEAGWYEGDPRGRLGYLNSALFRARRLVVDTGLHAKKWTRQQAIDYGISASEVERYVVWPGQACSYMIGQLRIVELREAAKRALGDKFSIQRFHNVVLNSGNVPLSVLAQDVEAWVRESRGAN